MKTSAPFLLPFCSTSLAKYSNNSRLSALPVTCKALIKVQVKSKYKLHLGSTPNVIIPKNILLKTVYFKVVYEAGWLYAAYRFACLPSTWILMCLHIVYGG